MADALGRRGFLGAAGAAIAAGVAAQAAEPPAPPQQGVRILGIACSPRKGKTTAAAVQVCLDAAKAVSPKVETELIELAGLSIPGQLAAGLPLGAGERDDFPAVAAKLADRAVAGIIIGSPVYFNNMSYLAKAFLDRCMVFRKEFGLSGKVAGIVAVGAARNGGQELTVQSIQAALLSHEVLVVGTARPTGRAGATLVNQGDDITGDDFGLATAKNLGRRVAEVALHMTGLPG